MYPLLGVFYILTVGFIIGAVVVGFFLKYKFENHKWELDNNFEKDLREKLNDRADFMCKNCYYKKRCEELENGQKQSPT